MLLAALGIQPTAIKPADIDETPYKRELPAEYVRRMACEKAAKIAQQNPDQLTLAADTVVACGRRILPKAETYPQASACLRQLSSRRHRVLTAFALMKGTNLLTCKTVTSMVQFKRLSEADVRWYLGTGEWEGKAGGYAIQGAAQAFIRRLNGSYSAVVGLPLLELRHALLQEGWTSD